MRILLIDNGSNLLTKLGQLIPGDEVTQSPDAAHAETFDAVILSGGPHSGSEGGFDKEVQIIKSGRPVIGICFGCELIACAFGGEVKELPEEQRGVYEIELMDERLGGPKKIKVYEGHKQYISKMPEEFEILAQSGKGPEIIKHQSLAIYGLQFHPENMVEETEGDELFLSLLKQF